MEYNDYKSIFYKDLKKGYTIVLAKCSNGQLGYKVQSFCRFLPYKEVILSGDEMTQYFSDIIIYLLTQGFIIKFKDGQYEPASMTLVELTVKYIGEYQSYILSSMDIFNPNIPFSKSFKNYYIDYMLSHMEITNGYHNVLLDIHKRSKYDR